MDVPEVMLRLSVVVLNYNGRAWLDRCLSTLASQRVVGGFEVILADNASPDG
ncbi:MAG: glycosyltransferase family 2 protein, partial [Verrucomicrobiota bacterium]